MPILPPHVTSTTWVTDSTNDPRANVSAIVRQNYLEEARRGGDLNDLWQSARSKCHNVHVQFYLAPHTRTKLDWDMHDLWYLYYQASSKSQNLPKEARTANEGQ